MSLIKFRTGSYKIEIDEVEVIRETPKQVVIAWDGYGGKTERREAKRSDYGNYFDTWKQAHDFLVDKAQNDMELAQRRFENSKEKLQTLLNMKEPSAEGSD